MCQTANKNWIQLKLFFSTDSDQDPHEILRPNETEVEKNSLVENKAASPGMWYGSTTCKYSTH